MIVIISDLKKVICSRLRGDQNGRSLHNICKLLREDKMVIFDSIVNVLMCQLKLLILCSCLFLVTAGKYLCCFSKEIQHLCTILYYHWELSYPKLGGMLCLCLTATVSRLLWSRQIGNNLLLCNSYSVATTY